MCNSIGIGIGISILSGIGIGIGIDFPKMKVLVLVLVLKLWSPKVLVLVLVLKLWNPKVLVFGIGIEKIAFKNWRKSENGIYIFWDFAECSWCFDWRNSKILPKIASLCLMGNLIF